MNCPIQETNYLFEIIKWATPIILFFLGLYFNKLSEKLKENRRLKKIEIYFFELIENLNSKITEEIKIMEECIEKLENWDKTDFILNQSANRVTERILELKQEDLFNNFVLRKKGDKKEKVKDFKNLNGLIDYLLLIFPHILNTNKHEVDKLNIYRNNWNLTHDETISFHNELISIEYKKGIDKFFDEFDEIIYNFRRKYNGTQNMEIGFNELVFPLIDLCKKHSNDRRSAKLMTFNERSKMAYEEIKRIRERHSALLKDTIKSMIDTQKSLIKISNKIKSKKNHIA